MAFLEVKNIKKSFGKTEVLKGIDFASEVSLTSVMISLLIGGTILLIT